MEIFYLIPITTLSVIGGIFLFLACVFCLRISISIRAPSYTEELALRQFPRRRKRRTRARQSNRSGRRDAGIQIYLDDIVIEPRDLPNLELDKKMSRVEHCRNVPSSDALDSGPSNFSEYSPPLLKTIPKRNQSNPHWSY